MESSKLFGRVENLQWDAPELTFVNERHGGAGHLAGRIERRCIMLLDLAYDFVLCRQEDQPVGTGGAVEKIIRVDRHVFCYDFESCCGLSTATTRQHFRGEGYSKQGERVCLVCRCRGYRRPKRRAHIGRRLDPSLS